MSLFNNKDTHLRYRYRVRKFSVLFEDGKEMNLDTNRLVQVEIEHDYENNYFPIIKIKTAMNTEDYYKILDSKNTCKIFLRITKYAYKNGERQVSTPESIIVNQSFNLIMNEGTDNMYDSVKRSEEPSYTRINRPVQINSSGDENDVELYLYADNVINTRQLINKVYSNVSVTDTITKIFNDAKVNKVYMIPPDNGTVYDELLIPPLTMVKALSFIDTYYGIYKEGSLIYFDIDKVFVIPYTGKPFKSNNMSGSDITNIVIPVTAGSSMSSSTGNIKKNDSDENFIVMDGDSINIENKSITNNFIQGNDLLLIDGIEGNSSSKSSASSKDGNFSNVFENNTMNPLMSSMYTTQTTLTSNIVTMRLMDYDITNVGLDKVLHLTFEDTKYIKKYRSNYILTYASHSFIKQGDELQLYSLVRLKKAER